MRIVSAVPSILLVFYGVVGATTPPRSPDYCGPTVCIEISPSFGAESVRTASSLTLDSVQSEVEVIGRQGKVVVVIKPVPENEECKFSKSLTLVRTAKGMEADGVIEGPGKESCLHVSLSFADNSDGKNSSISPPVTTIWAVDKLPSTFWEKGYALRLGSQVDVLGIKGGGG